MFLHMLSYFTGRGEFWQFHVSKTPIGGGGGGVTIFFFGF